MSGPAELVKPSLLAPVEGRRDPHGHGGGFASAAWLSVFEWGDDRPDGRLRDRRLVSSERAERVSVCEGWACEAEGGH